MDTRTRLERTTVLSASTISGTGVRNSQGEDLGDIKDLMIDLHSGQIAYAVLSFGGFLGMGDKLFAIPWQAFRLDQDSETIILDVPRERLEEAPGFDKDNWPQMSDQEWGREVHRYYGYDPFWERDKD